MRQILENDQQIMLFIYVHFSIIGQFGCSHNPLMIALYFIFHGVLCNDDLTDV